MSPTISRIEQVRRAILYQIFCGVLAPGRRLLETKLASEFGVSQATVNAALLDMHDQGIVTKMPNRYSEVRRYSFREIDNLFSVRLILEPAAASVAASALNADGVRKLTVHLNEMRAAAATKDIPRFCLADYTFHQEIYSLSFNSFLEHACQAIAAAPFAYILCGSPVTLPADYSALAEDHHQIIQALQEGPEAAARISRERIEAWRSHSERALTAPALS